MAVYGCKTPPLVACGRNDSVATLSRSEACLRAGSRPFMYDQPFGYDQQAFAVPSPPCDLLRQSMRDGHSGVDVTARNTCESVLTILLGWILDGSCVDLGWILGGPWGDIGWILSAPCGDIGRILGGYWVELCWTLGKSWVHIGEILDGYSGKS